MSELITKIQLEEDLFPMNYTDYINKSYGVLFYNEDNKRSYDSNHALIYKDKIKDLDSVLEEIVLFYKSKYIHPSIYQALGDEGFFTDEQETFNRHGFRTWIEDPANIMLLSEDSQLKEHPDLEIKLLTEWDERIATEICMSSNESNGIEVFKRSIKNEDSRVFLACYKKEAVGILNLHVSNRNCCRYDYILISENHRNKGYASGLLASVTNYCRHNNISNCFQWPAHKHSEYICHQAGFRHLFESEVARASYTTGELK